MDNTPTGLDALIPTPSSTGELGIENAKAFITALAGQIYAASTIDADGDGAISTTEWTSFGTGFVLAALGNLTIGRNAFPEFADLKGAEFGQLTGHVLSTDFLPDDKQQAEDLVKLVIVAANANRLLIEGIVSLSKGEELDFDPLVVFGATFGS